MSTAKFDSKGYCVIIKNDEEYFIAKRAWFETMPLNSTYDEYGHIAGASDAGDYLHITSDEMRDKLQWEYNGDWERYEVSAWADLEKFDFVIKNGDEGEDYDLFESECTAYNYWNGHNWQSIIVECDNFDPAYCFAPDEDQEIILKAFFEADGQHWADVVPENILDTEKYTFKKSESAAAWYIARVEF